jgi:hypothetical protein
VIIALYYIKLSYFFESSTNRGRKDNTMTTKLYSMEITNLFNFADDYVRNLRPWANAVRLIFMSYILELTGWGDPCARGTFARFEVKNRDDKRTIFAGTFAYLEDGTIDWLSARWKEGAARRWMETLGISAINAANNALWEARKQNPQVIKKYYLDKNVGEGDATEAATGVAEDVVVIEPKKDSEPIVLDGGGNYIRRKGEWPKRGYYTRSGKWVPQRIAHSHQPVGENYKDHRHRKEE